MNDFELVFYRKANGDCPVMDFLDSLSPVLKFKTMHSLDLLEIYGNHPKGDFTKPMGDAIFEIRSQSRTQLTRIFFFFDKNRKIVLTNGYVKKQQRASLADLELAKKYRADYFARTQNKEYRESDDLRVTNGPKWRPKLDAIVEEAQDKSKLQEHKQHNKKQSKAR